MHTSTASHAKYFSSRVNEPLQYTLHHTVMYALCIWSTSTRSTTVQNRLTALSLDSSPPLLSLPSSSLHSTSATTALKFTMYRKVTTNTMQRPHRTSLYSILRLLLQNATKSHSSLVKHTLFYLHLQQSYLYPITDCTSWHSHRKTFVGHINDSHLRGHSLPTPDMQYTTRGLNRCWRKLANPGHTEIVMTLHRF